MFKKKKQDNIDYQYRNLYEEMNNARQILIGKTRAAIIKEKAITLYPAGPDKDRAIKDFETSQKMLIASMGAYEARWQELIDYVKKNYDSHYYLRNLPPTGHETVEFIISTTLG